MFKCRTSRFVSLLLILFILLLLSGCGQVNDTVTDPPTTPLYEYEFVGSINSNKYHYPSCEWANRIYPKNEVK